MARRTAANRARPGARALAHVRATKVKLAVSGCLRNCAESGIKDVRIIGVDSGWEIHIAGNGGIKTEVAHFFTKVKTAEEVMEVNGAFLQRLYREEAGTWSAPPLRGARAWDHEEKGAARRGQRQALWARHQAALDGEPDPWFEDERRGWTRASSSPIAVPPEPGIHSPPWERQGEGVMRRQAHVKPSPHPPTLSRQREGRNTAATAIFLNKTDSSAHHTSANNYERYSNMKPDWTWYICQLNDIPRQGARRVMARPQGLEVALFRTGQDAVYALLDHSPTRAAH